MRRFSQTAWQIFNAARPTAITAATTSFSWEPSRPMPITGRSRCCSPAAATAGFSTPTMPPAPPDPHEKESAGQTCACEAEAVVSGRSPQGVRCQGDGVFFGTGIWRRDPRPGAPAGGDAAVAVPLLSEQGRIDQGGLSRGLSRAVRYGLGEAFD